MLRIGIAVGLLVMVLAGPQSLLAADSNPASGDKKESGAEYRQVYGQWQAALADIAHIQTKIQVATPAEREAFAQQYREAIAKAETFVPRLQTAAEQAFATDDKNRELGELLLAMAVNHLRKDNYEEALRLAKFLMEHKYSEKEMRRVAASAQFATMQLNEAKQSLEAAGDGKAPSEPDIQSLLDQIETYRPKWEREQKFRAADAKADDLPRVKLHTTEGDLVVELFENEAPNTVANFINLVEKGVYDETQFHRVLPGFMAQGGDPLSKDPVKNAEMIGRGGPGYNIPSETKNPNHREHFRGSLSMALGPEGPDSGGSQFFIMFGPASHLDGGFTVFGQVIDGMDVLAKIQRIDPEKPTNVTPDKITKAEVLRKRNHPYEPKTTPKK